MTNRRYWQNRASWQTRTTPLPRGAQQPLTHSVFELQSAAHVPTVAFAESVTHVFSAQQSFSSPQGRPESPHVAAQKPRGSHAKMSPLTLAQQPERHCDPSLHGAEHRKDPVPSGYCAQRPEQHAFRAIVHSAPTSWHAGAAEATGRVWATGGGRAGSHAARASRARAWGRIVRCGYGLTGASAFATKPFVVKQPSVICPCEAVAVSGSSSRTVPDTANTRLPPVNETVAV
jgi:hypothetical protein